jgi:UDP-glucose 4-epimerase
VQDNLLTETILLTGGAGYIGSHTCVALVAAGYRVVILDNFSNARADVPERLERLTGAQIPTYRADIRDTNLLRRIFADHDIGAVIHLAARKAVNESAVIPLDYMDQNVTGLIALLKAMQEARVFNLVFSSSAAVYGIPESVPIAEDAKVGFTSPYAFTKLVGEQTLAHVSAADDRWKIGVLRYFNPAGAHPSALIGEDPYDVPNNLMPIVASVALGQLGAIHVFGDDFDTSDGTGVRDYIHVDDLAQGHVLSLQSIFATETGHVVNLGSGRGYSVLEVIAAYSAACGRDLPYVMAPRRACDAAASYADPRRAEALLGFKATRGLAEMCQTSWAWVSSRPTQTQRSADCLVSLRN